MPQYMLTGLEPFEVSILGSGLDKTDAPHSQVMALIRKINAQIQEQEAGWQQATDAEKGAAETAEPAVTDAAEGSSIVDLFPNAETEPAA